MSCSLKLTLVVSLLSLSPLSQAGLIDWLGGNFNHNPSSIDSLSPGAQQLINKAFHGIPEDKLHDFHVHVVGMGTANTGTWLNPKLQSWRHPFHKLKTQIYLSGANVSDTQLADQQYLKQLLSLIRTFGHKSKLHILAFDYYYNDDGSINYQKSEFYTPNSYIMSLSEQYPALFIPTISVHPYRKDWQQALSKWHSKGARFIKWLPNAQGIDAANSKLDDYYRFIKENDMILLAHVGEEKAVEAEDDQKLGNPLRFRRPLNMGVKIIMAHSASLGSNEDFDNPGNTENSFNLFWRMLNNKQYEGLLFGEISAITQANRIPGPITQILAHPELQHRFVNGSDYPLPAINAVINTRKLTKSGLITTKEQDLLKEIYHYNPLLFDFVLKRTLKHPVTKKGLSANIFSCNTLHLYGSQGENHPCYN